MPSSRSVSIHSHSFSALSQNSVSDKQTLSISTSVNVCHGQLTFLQLPAEVGVVTTESPDDRELFLVIALGKYNMARTGVGLIFLICTCSKSGYLCTLIRGGRSGKSVLVVCHCVHLAEIFQLEDTVSSQHENLV